MQGLVLQHRGGDRTRIHDMDEGFQEELREVQSVEVVLIM